MMLIRELVVLLFVLDVGEWNKENNAEEEEEEVFCLRDVRAVTSFAVRDSESVFSGSQSIV